LTWHDEFDGAALDTAKWTCSNDEKEVNSWTSKDAVSLDNSGHLVITTRKVGARLVTGSLTSAGKFEHAFGYYACRLQFQKQPGFRSCFILNCDSMSKPGIHGRDGSRIFVAAKESVDDALRQFINRNGEGGPNNANGITTRTMTTAGLRDGWHTVGLWWTPEQYVFYIDGKETWRDTARNISQVPQYIELCTQVLPLAGNINNAKLPDACQVDYVRVYDTVDK
jgi:beta-glucanase (GH16 family)